QRQAATRQVRGAGDQLVEIGDALRPLEERGVQDEQRSVVQRPADDLIGRAAQAVASTSPAGVRSSRPPSAANAASSESGTPPRGPRRTARSAAPSFGLAAARRKAMRSPTSGRS